MQKYTKNDSKLSKYILSKTKEGKKLPYMTTIAKESGISVATISRYAKRKGFYSFAEMRATFNKDLSKPSFNDYGMIDKINEAKSIVIIASNFTSFLGEYIYSRLKYLRIPVSIVREDNFNDELDSIGKDSLIICTSLTGWSLRIEKVLNRKKDNKILLITTVNNKPKQKNVHLIPLTDFFSGENDNFEGYNSNRQIYLWLDDCLNILHLKMKY